MADIKLLILYLLIFMFFRNYIAEKCKYYVTGYK